ncbi:hypothetical protein MPF19_07075 [Polaribacter sp. Z014]|uniref:hypothetical protein n=1 Tax=unclassified Polaribacter TaxID=196858 RepID=UPI00193BDBFA|nr:MULTISPECIES: hypothetical protein [unclassified Polaribacter]MCL7763177.1 hypothetical protein [Polaribacter sp. Z014]QVY67116.1 hypothetical protein JOP69_07540 [Polaribacter sp. Q13]
MSNLKYISEKLKKNEIVYLLNEFEEIVIKLVPIKNSYKCIAKTKIIKSNEYEIDKTTNLALETEIGGKIITKKEYDEY